MNLPLALDEARRAHGHRALTVARVYAHVCNSKSAEVCSLMAYSKVKLLISRVQDCHTQMCVILSPISGNTNISRHFGYGNAIGFGFTLPYPKPSCTKVCVRKLLLLAPAKETLSRGPADNHPTWEYSYIFNFTLVCACMCLQRPPSSC